jgi:hypothetical protein
MFSDAFFLTAKFMATNMTPEEFKTAYLAAQNDLGNELQNFMSLSQKLDELTANFNQVSETIATRYLRMNQVVEAFISEQNNSSQQDE